MDFILWTVSECAYCDKEFSGVSLQALDLSWDSCSYGGRMMRPAIHASRICPANGLEL